MVGFHSIASYCLVISDQWAWRQYDMPGTALKKHWDAAVVCLSWECLAESGTLLEKLLHFSKSLWTPWWTDRVLQYIMRVEAHQIPLPEAKATSSNRLKIFSDWITAVWYAKWPFQYTTVRVVYNGREVKRGSLGFQMIQPSPEASHRSSLINIRLEWHAIFLLGSL